MNQGDTLERLYVELAGRDDDLQKSLADALRLSQETADAIEKNMGAAFNVARESSQQFTHDFTTAMQQAGGSTENIARDITQLNERMRENHEAVRAGEQSRETYRQTLDQQRQQLQTLITEYNRAARGLSSYDTALSSTVDENKELDETIKRLSNEVRTQRNLWAGRISDDAQFRQSTEALHREMRELAENTDLTGDQMRKLTGDMAYAQRGMDSVNKVASRGGLAWTAQIGIADAFGNSLRNLGPAGNTAAMGIASLAPVFTSLRNPISLTTESLTGLVRNLGGLVRMLPLLTAAAGVGAVAGLWRLANAHAELANQIDLATYRTGLSIEGYQELRHAASQTGVDVSILDTTMQRLQRRAADAHAGNENLSKSFRQLGVTLTDTDGTLLGTEELLYQVADGLSGVENNAERLRLAFTVFDTEGGRLLPLLAQGRDGIKALREEARDLGLVISGETVLSLVEFSNEVKVLQGQFQAAGVEITAAFLPVLRDVLIPLIQRFVVPWFQNVATAVGDFADKLIDTGPAGEEFRSEMADNLMALLRFRDGILVVVQGWIAFTGYISGGVARIGAEFGALSVMLESWFENLGRMMQGDFSGSVLLNYEDVSAIADAAANEYYTKANEASQKAANAFARIFDPEGYRAELEGLFNAVGDTVTRGASTGLADMLNVPEVGEFGNTIADAVTKGITAGVEEGLDEAIASIPAVPLGAGIDPAEQLARLEAATATYERETARAARIAEAAQTAENERLARIADSYRVLNAQSSAYYATMDRRDAFLAEYQVQEAAVEAARQGRIEVQAQVAGYQDMLGVYEQLTRVRAANAAIADPMDPNLAAGITAAYNQFADIMSGGGPAAEIDTFTQAVERMTDTRSEVERLRDDLIAFAAQGDGFAREVQPLIDALDALARSAAEVDAVEAAAQAAESAAGSYSTLLAAIEGIGRTVDPIEAQRQALRELAATGLLTSAQVIAAIQAEGQARERLATQAQELEVTGLKDEWAAVEEAIVSLTGTGQSEFDNLRDRIADVVRKLRDLGEEVDGVEELLAALDAAESTQNLVDTLGDVQNALHQIGGAAGGAFGEFVTGLGDAVGIATKFASGDIAGGVTDTIAAIVGGVSDIINANQEWARSIDQLAGRYSNLQRETIEALSKSRTETRWFLFIPYQVRVVDEGATNEAMRVAGTFMSALEGALTSADFEADFELGLDRILQAELIKGFMMTDEVQAAIVAFTQAIEDGDWSGARRAYDTLTEATRTQNELLQAQFPELYKNRQELDKTVDAAERYADALRRAVDETRNLQQGIAEGQLERQFARGVIGLEEYATRLQQVTRDGINLDFQQQMDDLKRLREEALGGVDQNFIADSEARIVQLEKLLAANPQWAENVAGEIRYIQDQIDAELAKADPQYLAGLEEQMRTLGDAWREALEQGAYEAAEAIKQILGTTVGDLQGVMRGALDSPDALAAWGDNLLMTTRNALITAFLEGAIMKPLLDNLSNAITDAVMDGVITPEELDRIKDLGEGVTGPMAQFVEMLDEVGLGLGDLGDNVNALNDSMRNVPTVFKATQAAMDSVNASAPRYVPQAPSAPPPPRYGGQDYTLGTNPVPMDGRPIVYITGDVYGFEDFEQKVQVAVSTGDERRNASSYGRS